MALVHVLGYYIIWHYTIALADMARIAGNYLWFVQNFFSMGLLSRTLLAPWRRLSVAGGRGREESYFGAFLINTLMRGVGFLIRALTILAGAAALFAVIVLAAAVALVWLLLPVVVFFLFFAGLGELLKMRT